MRYSEFENKAKHDLYLEEQNLDVDKLLDRLDLGKKEKRRLIPFWIILSGAIILLSGILYFWANKTENYVAYENYQSSSLNTYSANSKSSSKNITDIVADGSINIDEIATSNKTTGDNYNDLKNDQKRILWNNNKLKNTNSKNGVFHQNNKDKISTTLIAENNRSERLETARMEEAQKQNKEIFLEKKSLPSLQKLVSRSSLVQQKSSFKINQDVVCPTFNKKSPMTLSLIPEIGYSLPIKNLEATSSENNDLFRLRDNKEKSLEGLHAGLSLKLSKKDFPLSFRAGIAYSRIAENMKLDYNYVTRDTSIGIISITVSQNGDTITTIYGPIIEESTHTGTSIKHYYLKTLDLPLALAYEKNLGDFDLGIEGGVAFNLSLKSSGSLLNSNSAFTEINSSFSPFRSSIGLSYFGGVFLARSIGNLGRFVVTLRGKHFTSPFNNTDTNSIKQSYTLLGLHLGWEYRI